MSCLFGSQFTHTADIYKPVYSEDKISGQKKKTWSHQGTIKCHGKPVASRGVDGATGEKYISLYQQYTHIRVLAPSKIDTSWRISNIMGEDYIWTEEDGSPTIFEITGYIPKEDMFGVVMAYEMLCERSSEQKI